MIDLPDHKSFQLNLAKAADVMSHTGYNNLAGNHSVRNAQGADRIMNQMWNRQTTERVEYSACRMRTLGKSSQ